MKNGDCVSIEDGYITSWKEVKQLNIPQPPKGKLEVISDDNCKDDDDDPAMTDNYTDEEYSQWLTGEKETAAALQENIMMDDLCTYDTSDCHSFRRDGDRAGRMTFFAYRD